MPLARAPLYPEEGRGCVSQNVTTLKTSSMQAQICGNLLSKFYMVGQVGVDPTTPEGNGFTARRVCRFATDPYNGEDL